MARGSHKLSESRGGGTCRAMQARMAFEMPGCLQEHSCDAQKEALTNKDSLLTARRSTCCAAPLPSSQSKKVSRLRRAQGGSRLTQGSQPP